MHLDEIRIKEKEYRDTDQIDTKQVAADPTDPRLTIEGRKRSQRAHPQKVLRQENL